MNRRLSAQLLPWLDNLLWGIRQFLIVAGVVALGVSLAYLLMSPYIDLTISLIGVTIYLLIILVNPLAGLLIWFSLFHFSEQVINIPLPAGIPDLSPSRFVVMLLCVVLLGQVAIRRRHWPRLTRVDWAFFAFILAVVATSFTSPNIVWELQFNLDRYIMPILVYFIVKNLVMSRRHVDLTLYTLLFIAFYAALLIIHEQITSLVIDFGPPSSGVVTVDYIYRSYTESLRLAQVPILNGIAAIGLIFTMCIPFAFYYLFKTESVFKKFLCLLLIGLMFVGLFYTYKRAAWFTLPASFLVIQFFYPRFRRFFIALVIVVGILLAFTWNQVNESAVVTERVKGAKLETANGRTDLWEDAIRLWKKRPIFGYGFSQFEKVSRFDGATENFYLMVLVSVGLVGFIPYILMLIFVVTDSIVIYRQIGQNSFLFIDRHLMAVFWGAFLAYVMKSFSGNQAMVVSNVMFMVIIGTIVGSQQAALARSKEERSASAP